MTDWQFQNSRFEIIQRPTRILIGHSIGRWEGDVLAAETVGFNDHILALNFTSHDLKTFTKHWPAYRSRTKFELANKLLGNAISCSEKRSDCSLKKGVTKCL
jgi:hypothetical protein